MSAALAVVATGARTPVGRTAATSAAAIRAGISRAREFPFVGATGEPLVAAADPDLDPACTGLSRFAPMLRDALAQVVRVLAPASRHPCVHHVLLAAPEVRPGFDESDAADLLAATRAALQGSFTRVEVTIPGHGHAGGLRGVEQAQQILAADPNALCWIAGVDSYLHPSTLLWLEHERRLAAPGVRGGFIPGEGAGCVALATDALRERLGLTSLADLRGACTAQEMHLRTDPAGSFGHAMSAVVEAAAASLRLPDEQIDGLISDLNGERYRSEEWGFVALRTAPLWRSLQYEAPADRWGDVGAAFGPLALLLAAHAFQRNYARGPRALVTAGSDRGLRGAALLQRPGEPTAR